MPVLTPPRAGIPAPPDSPANVPDPPPEPKGPEEPLLPGFDPEREGGGEEREDE